MGDAGRLLHWVVTHEDCAVYEVPDQSLMPLALFMEVPDGAQQYLDTLIRLNLHSEKNGERRAEPIPVRGTNHCTRSEQADVRFKAMSKGTCDLKSYVFGHCTCPSLCEVCV